MTLDLAILIKSEKVLHVLKLQDKHKISTLLVKIKFIDTSLGVLQKARQMLAPLPVSNAHPSQLLVCIFRQYP